MASQTLTSRIEALLFGFRAPVLIILLLLTAFMGYMATKTHVDAGFEKQLPLQHEYMGPYLEYLDQFGGGNRVLIALIQDEDKGDIFNPEFFDLLETMTDEARGMPGAAQSLVTSIFTPNVRYVEAVEGGLDGGDVIPADFQATERGLEQVRQNVIKSGQVGRLVTSDYQGAMIELPLLERDPRTGERLDYVMVAERLEELRQKYQTEDISIHIIGFAKVVGDVVDATEEVLLFFVVTLLITALLLYIYSGSMLLTILPLGTSIVAVIWQFGLLNVMGYGIDPMSILVPFLVLAIGVSHGVQMINAWMSGILEEGASSLDAARSTFRRLLVPGTVALVSDTAGFLTILVIQIEIIQETAITASLGVGVIIITNLILLPVLLSYTRLRNIEKYRDKARRRQEWGDGLWRTLSGLTQRGPATVAVIVAVGLLSFGLWKANDVAIGDQHEGVPELRPDSRFNQDAAAIVSNFDIGVDVLTVFGETHPDGCTEYPVMANLDNFAWTVTNIKGVQSAITLPVIAKIVNAGMNEGWPKWQILPRNQFMLVQSIYPIPTESGLLDADCSTLPVYIFLEDHKAETINRVIDGINDYRARYETDDLRFVLASGNVGVMAATNDAVEAAQVPMLVYVYLAIIILCLLTFRSLRGTLCIVLPLALVSVLAYATMAMLEIGLKVSTLPVAALGVGIGVDYGIYIYSRLEYFLKQGLSLREAHYQTLRSTGKPVFFTGLTLAVGVATWTMSGLQFQADMGIMLTFMFLVNMLAAIVLLPALAHFLIRPETLAGKE